MEQTFQQEFAIEQRPRSIVAADTLVADYGTAATLTVQALPAEAAAGKTLLAQSYATDVAVTDATQYTLDAQGRATITVNTLLTGVTRVNYQLAGTDVVAGTTVIVRKAETTGIDGIADRDASQRQSQAAGQRIYNLSGQRLTAPKRGLNIVDGKIMVVF
jgi:ribosomal protein L13